jgi:aminopeptidase N
MHSVHMTTRTLLCLFTVFFAAACSSPVSEPPASGTPEPAARSPEPGRLEPDVHSFARPAEARVTHVALDLRADFTARQLSGTAELTVARNAGATQVVLDTRDLDIERVTDRAGAMLQTSFGESDPILGRSLTVTLPAQGSIVVHYRTSTNAAALQWLAPPQTAGKKQPYLYSQGQAILTRTWIPTQDSPGIRQTYSARIVVPKDLRAVMSAEHLTPDGVAAGDERAFEFKLTHPVPPYLIALAIGDLASRAIGPRTAVFSEPSVQDRAAFEFADLEKMVQTAEPLLGPYRWGRYDLLVLPPSFPFGGMENPRLTFATPTILAGDRSLVALVAHELAHSWSGNLVTNATWSDFWLNEGTTTYVERRIMEALYGVERAQILRVLAWTELQDEIARLGGPSSKDTVLHVDLRGRDPDDGATQIPYDKGATFLEVIEAAVGRERFDRFLRGYFERHAFQPITSAQFLADVRADLIKADAALEKTLLLDEWVYQPGLPANAVAPRSEALERVKAQADAFARGTSAAALMTAGWSTQEWQHFLANLPQMLTPAQLGDLDRAFTLTANGNSEVLSAWLRIGIRHHYQPAMPALERFLTTQGRRKFLRPLYEDLMKQDWGKTEARRIYAKARPLYHSVATGTLDAIVR